MEFRDKPMENLIRLQEKDICKNARALLLDGESIVGAYKTVRDQVIFTTHRIIMVDMQGVTGTRQQIFVLPYRKGLYRPAGTVCGRQRHQPVHPVNNSFKTAGSPPETGQGAFCCI